GRELPLATVMADDTIAAVKWVRKKLSSVAAVSERNVGNSRKSEGHPPSPSYGVQARPFQRTLTKSRFEELVLPLVAEVTGGKINSIAARGVTIYARLDFSAVQISA